VLSKWTDMDRSGQPRTDEITWMLRREAEGWRVAGMAATVFEGEPPLLLDFEQPEETMRRLDLLSEEVQRRMAKEQPGQWGRLRRCGSASHWHTASSTPPAGSPDAAVAPASHQSKFAPGGPRDQGAASCPNSPILSSDSIRFSQEIWLTVGFATTHAALAVPPTPRLTNPVM